MLSSEPVNTFRWPNVDEIKKSIERLLHAPTDGFGWSNPAERGPDLALRLPRSAELARTSASLIAGGSHHSLISNAPFPLFANWSNGARTRDVDGNEYIDFVQAGGATILAEEDQQIVLREAMKIMSETGPAIGVSHPAENRLASLVTELMPAIERLRMTASGTEAAMAAIRIARAHTEASHVIKVGAAYHGWSDHLVYGLRMPGTARQGVNGIPVDTHSYIHEVPPGDLEALNNMFSSQVDAGGTAAVLVEPLGPQSGSYPVKPEYHREVSQLCQKFGALLIFDEVVTGFRLGLAGVSSHLGIQPDLTILGKCLTGGFPAAGAIGGRAEVMNVLTPGHQKYAFVTGTLSANPLSCAAGSAALGQMRESDSSSVATQAGDALSSGLAQLVEKYRLPFVTYNFGSIVHLHTSGIGHLSLTHPNFKQFAKSRKAASDAFIGATLSEGLLVPVTGRMFTSAAHTPDDIADALGRFERVFAAL